MRKLLNSCRLGAAGIMGVAATFCAGVANADVCQYEGNTIPQCYVQTDTGTLGGDRHEYMNVYCPAGMYAWGSWSDTWSSHWHLTTFNPVGSYPNSMDFALSNTSVHDNNWSLSIGCSPINPNGTCTGATKMVKDPGCPMSDVQNECQPADNCWLTWNEQCINGNVVSNYFCSEAIFITTCYGCEASQ